MCRPWSAGHDPARCLCACVRVRVCACVRVCGVCVCVCVRACVLSRAAWHTVCVNCDKTIKIDPVIRDSHRGKKVSLGSFATAEEAALCVARSPEGQAAV
eukprot:scaffold4029_cov62-Phaeocystis_antarctica.AAC.2